MGLAMNPDVSKEEKKRLLEDAAKLQEAAHEKAVGTVETEGLMKQHSRPTELDMDNKHVLLM